MRPYAASVGIPSLLSLPVLPLGIMRSRTGNGVNTPAFSCWRVSLRSAATAASSEMDRGATRSTPAVRAPLVPAHPVPGNRQEIRVRDEVEQIIKPAAGICGRPTVQLGLHPQYPPPGLIQL